MTRSPIILARPALTRRVGPRLTPPAAMLMNSAWYGARAGALRRLRRRPGAR
jgi:hypothetical protein